MSCLTSKGPQRWEQEVRTRPAIPIEKTAVLIWKQYTIVLCKPPWQQQQQQKQQQRKLSIKKKLDSCSLSTSSKSPLSLKFSHMFSCGHSKVLTFSVEKLRSALVKIPVECAHPLYLHLGFKILKGRPMNQLGILQEFWEVTYMAPHSTHLKRRLISEPLSVALLKLQFSVEKTEFLVFCRIHNNYFIPEAKSRQMVYLRD